MIKHETMMIVMALLAALIFTRQRENYNSWTWGAIAPQHVNAPNKRGSYYNKNIQRWVYKNKVTAWEHANYTGKRMTFGVGDHPFTGRQAWMRGRISSIYIPEQFKVQIYKGTNFTGEQGEWRRKEMSYVGDWWNDKVFSLRVQND